METTAFSGSSPITKSYLPKSRPARLCVTANIRSEDCPHRVLVTAPSSYATRLVPHLLSHNLRPILAPTITTALLHDDRIGALQDALLRLHEHQVLACLSRPAISSVANQLMALCDNDTEAASIALQASGIRVAALGADALAVKHLLGRPADIIPFEASPSGLVQFLRADDRLKGAAILCPIPVVTEMQEPAVVPSFLNELRQAGFIVTAVPSYETRPVKRESLDVELRMLSDVDAIVISSTGEAIALNALLSEQERNLIRTRVTEGHLTLAAHGPITAKGVQDVFSLDTIISDNYASFEGVARVLSRELFKDRLVLPS